MSKDKVHFTEFLGVKAKPRKNSSTITIDLSKEPDLKLFLNNVAHEHQVGLQKVATAMLKEVMLRSV